MGSEIVVGARRGKATRRTTAWRVSARSADRDGGAETQDDRVARPARMSLFSRITGPNDQIGGFFVII
jgi:hypothetical protein